MALSTKLAVIDVGSNSSKVLISNVSRDGQVNKIIEKSHACRLIDSEYSKTRRLSDESQQNLIDVLSDLLSLCENENVDESVVVATAAVRNATNSSNLITKVKERFSLELKVLTGEEESHLIGRGLLLDPSLDGCRFFQAFDLGGGSLELIQFQVDAPTLNKSLPLGALSVSEGLSLDITKPFLFPNELRLRMREQVGNCGLILDQDCPLIGLGGAIFYIRKIFSRIKNLNFEECKEFSLDEISWLASKGSGLSLQDRLIKFPELPADRGDVFPVVCIIIEEIMKTLSKDTFLHSQFNLRYGVAAKVGCSDWKD